jgi:hypothetical protein
LEIVLFISTSLSHSSAISLGENWALRKLRPTLGAMEDFKPAVLINQRLPFGWLSDRNVLNQVGSSAYLSPETRERDGTFGDAMCRGNGEAVVQLRVIYFSKDFDPHWAFHIEEGQHRLYPHRWTVVRK